MKATCLLLCMAVATAVANSEYHFVGFRDPVVTIDDASLPWKTSVSFHMVKCFDSRLNNSINLGKAKSYLAMALLKKLDPLPNDSSINIHGLQMLRSRIDSGGRFTAEFQLPEKPTLVRSPKIADCNSVPDSAARTAANESKGSASNGLLSRKSDWMQTLDATKSALSSEFPQKPTNSQADVDRFCNQIASKEDIIHQTFDSLKSQISTDIRLLLSEKKEISTYSAQSEKETVASLKEYAVTCIPTN